MTDQFKNIRTAQEIVSAVKKEQEMEQQSLIGTPGTQEESYTVNQLPQLPGTTEFKSGAVRSSELKGLRYDLISPVALRRLAAAYGEGAEKYSAFNCEKGFSIFGDEGLFTHAFAHLMKFAWGDTTEDHLGHLLWNVAMMCHSQECWPELNAGTSRIENVPLEKRQDAIDRQKVRDELNTSASDAVNALRGYVEGLPGKTVTMQHNDFVKPGTIYGVSEHEAAPYIQPAQINQEAFLSPEAGVAQEVKRPHTEGDLPGFRKPPAPSPYPHRADIKSDFESDDVGVTDIVRTQRSG